MEMPIVDNEFLSLFLPEDSHFSTEDILNDFKFYIFRIMSLSLDSLVQEQINNEYECNLTRKDFRSFFDEKINTVMDVFNLYNSLQDKLALIKHSLDKNKSLIEENCNLFSTSWINDEISIYSNSIQINKNLSIRHAIILDLISIPNSMINCFRNGCLDLYLDYLKYVRSLDSRDIISDNIDYGDDMITLIKSNVERLNNVIKVLIEKMLLNGNLDLNPIETSEFKLEDVYEILDLEKLSKEIFESSIIDKINESSLKKVVVILFSVKLYYKDRLKFNYGNDQVGKNELDKMQFLKHKNILQFFDYCKEKIGLISLIGESDDFLSDSCKKFLIERYIFPLTKENFFRIGKSNLSFTEFKEKRDYLETFFNEINLNLNEPALQNSEISYTLCKIKEFIKEQFFTEFEQILYFNVNAVKRYLTRIKDFKKLFAADNQIRNELILIIQSNLSEISSEISYQSFNSIRDKFRLFLMIEKNIKSLLNIIQNFFYDDFFLIKLNESNSDQEKLNVKNFKLLLFDAEKQTGIILEFLRSIYVNQGLKQYWEKIFLTSKIEEWENFLQIE